MIVIDLNLRIYAINQDAPQHAEARAWWEQTLANDTRVGMAWTVVIGFLCSTDNDFSRFEHLRWTNPLL